MANDSEDTTSFFDLRDARSVINLLPDTVKKAALMVPVKYYKMTTEQLRNVVEPSQLTDQIRISFWNKYEDCQDTMRRAVAIGEVYKQLCSREFFYKVFLTEPKNVAWMLRMPHDYNMAMQQVLELGMQQMRDIMLLKHVKDGKADSRLIAEKVKIFSLIDNRVKGAVTQRMVVDQRNVNMNVELREAPKTVEEVDEELLRLSKKIKEIEVSKNGDYFKEAGRGEIIDVGTEPKRLAKAKA